MSKPPVSRRRILQSLAATSALSVLAGCVGSDSAPLGMSSTPDQVPTPDPVPPGPGPVPPAFVQPVTRTAGSSGLLDTTLVTRFGTNTVNGQPFTARSYEGKLCGPTLRCRPGQTLRVLIDNQFPLPDVSPNPPISMDTPHEFNTTNLHTHGLHVSPSGNSDNIFVSVHPQTQMQYEYHIPGNHPPGTYWYHPHRHGAASVQMFGGMAGALIVEGGLDDVPEVAAARDLVFVITELNIKGGVVPDFTGRAFTQGANRVFVVNGEVKPTLTMFSGEVVRLRVINGSPRTTIPFLVQGHDLHVAAMDGICLPHLSTTSDPVQLVPANRADVLLKALAPGTYTISKGAYNPGGVLDPAESIATLVVLDTVVSMKLPTTLPAPPNLPNITDAEIAGRTRTIAFDIPTNPAPIVPPLANFSVFTIDGRVFDPNVINYEVALGTAEEWTLTNTGANPVDHPFHIHINPFQVVKINGVSVPPEWHDTVNIPRNGSVTIRHRFEDFRGLFVFHCHILIHEDVGMMQTVNVV